MNGGSWPQARAALALRATGSSDTAGKGVRGYELLADGIIDEPSVVEGTRPRSLIASPIGPDIFKNRKKKPGRQKMSGAVY